MGRIAVNVRGAGLLMELDEGMASTEAWLRADP
jgi:hypothetical protein